MMRINASDQVLLLLREHLRRSQTASSGKATEARSATPQARLAALAATRDLPDRAFKRAVVRGLVGERLGESLVADPAFDAVIGQIMDMLSQDPGAAELLDRAADRLRLDTDAPR